MQHDPVPLDEAGRQELGLQLLNSFNANEEITALHRVGTGANAANHFVIHTASDLRFGMKVVTRIPDGLEKERVIAQLGEILHMPNICRVVTVDSLHHVPQIPVPVNMSRWLPNSKTLGQLTSNEVADIVDGPQQFLRQFGAWAAFGLSLGIRDRHEGNFVWSPSDSNLSMIDMEEAFHSAELAEYRWVSRFINPATKSVALEAIKAGVDDVFRRFKEESPQIRAVLLSYPFASGYESSFLKAGARAAMQQLAQLVG